MIGFYYVVVEFREVKILYSFTLKKMYENANRNLQAFINK